jgi:hypothetical protein
MPMDPTKNGCAFTWSFARSIIFQNPRERVSLFLHNLDDKRQTKAQQLEASQAIELYYELIDSMAPHEELGSPQKVISPGKLPDESPHSSGSSPNPVADLEKVTAQGQVTKEPPLPLLPSTQSRKVTTGVSWKAEYAKLAQEIQVRHYSPKTLKTYTQWVRHYQTFTRSTDSKSLASDQVKGFLTFLAVDRKVSASTQNQAFNALLFFYRHVLEQGLWQGWGGL